MLRLQWVGLLLVVMVIVIRGGWLTTGWLVQSYAAPPGVQFAISGQISEASGPAGGVRVYLYQATNPNTAIQNVLTSPLLGSYSFSEVAPGQYIVRPEDGRYTFEPLQRLVDVELGDVNNVDFVALEQGATAGGRILDSADEGIAGIAVSLYEDTADTPIASTQSGNSGAYGFPNLEAGTYRVKPSSSLYDFVPIERAFTITTTHIITLNFQATTAAPTYAIQGQVLHRQAGLQGVTLTLTLEDDPQPVATAVTNGEGNYSVAAVSAGRYQITPALDGYAFTPSAQAITVEGNTVVAPFEAETLVNSNRLLYLPVVRRR